MACMFSKQLAFQEGQVVATLLASSMQAAKRISAL